MNFPSWHETAIEKLASFFQADTEVVCVALFGSAGRPDGLQDAWSDIDALIVVESDALPRYHPDVGWMSALGSLYVFEQFSGTFSQVTRACFRDGSKLDFVFTTPESLERVEEWPSVPWSGGVRILFSRTETIREILTRHYTFSPPALLTPEAFEAMTRQFRFKGLLATTKVARNDLLIALHLVLEMQQDCCVLGMILRDRAEGTNHHRTGGIGNAFAAQWQAHRFDYDAQGILAGIIHCLIVYDDLAGQWADSYCADNTPILEAIQTARDALR